MLMSVGKKGKFVPILSQTYHHFHPWPIFLPFGCVSQARIELIGFLNHWRSKDASQYLVSKILLNLLQNIIGIVKNGAIQGYMQELLNFKHSSLYADLKRGKAWLP
jgi:hypothetical protein